MKKKPNKNFIKIVSATSVCIFALFAVFSGALAWFSMIEDADASGVNIGVGIEEHFNKISYYQYLSSPAPTDDACSFNMTPYASITYNSSTRSFNNPVDGSGNTLANFNLVMDQYEPMSKHKPILVIAELSQDITCEDNGMGGIRVFAYTETEGYLGEKNENHQPAHTLGSNSDLKIVTINGVDYYPLSSVVHFRAKAFSQAQYNAWINGKSSFDVTGLTDEDTDWLGPADNNFAEASSDIDEVDTSEFHPRSTVYSSTYSGDETIKYIAIVVDYYDFGIEYIYSTFLGNETLESTYAYVLHFVCDWKWEIG